LPIIRSYLLYIQQWYIPCRFDESFPAGSGWNPDGFIEEKFVAMHGHMNVKCRSTVESFTGKLVKHTRKLCQARNETARGKGLQKIKWNKMPKAEKGDINLV
jgi:hypothetical protein